MPKERIRWLIRSISGHLHAMVQFVVVGKFKHGLEHFVLLQWVFQDLGRRDEELAHVGNGWIIRQRLVIHHGVNQMEVL